MDAGEKSSGTNQSWLGRSQAVFMPNVAPAPLVVERGEGCYVWDVEGRRYLDAISGIAVSALGHGHPQLASALADQARRLLHTSNLYLNTPAIELAERIVEACGADRVFFCNSGAEANEAAIKLARRYHFSVGDGGRYRILSFRGGFHGRTYGALAATAQPKYHEGFGPMPEGFDAVDYGDVAGLEAALSERTAAVLIEPVQGEGGVNPAPAGFLERCRELADKYGALVIMDEVQTGCGRTGRMFAHQHWGVEPDVLTMAKGIAGGLPLGAIAAQARVAAALVPGTHNTTYSGNPLACRAGLVVNDVLRSPGFLEGVEAVGTKLRRSLERWCPAVFREVRGLGLLVGAELAPDSGLEASQLVAACRDLGLLVHVAGPRVLRLAPPLVFGASECEEAIHIVSMAIDRCVEARGATSSAS